MTAALSMPTQFVLVRKLTEHRTTPPPRPGSTPETLRLVRTSASTMPTYRWRPPPDHRELHRLLAAVLEVLAARRPSTQLGALFTDAARRRLLAEPAARSHWTLRSLHPQRTARDAVELCASVAAGHRIRALTARLEPVDGTWRFTVFRLL